MALCTLSRVLHQFSFLFCIRASKDTAAADTNAQEKFCNANLQNVPIFMQSLTGIRMTRDRNLIKPQLTTV